MSAKELRRAAAMRRMLEGTIATVLGGTILWCVTNSPSRPVFTLSPKPTAVEMSSSVSAAVETPADNSLPPIQAGVTPGSASPPTAEMSNLSTPSPDIAQFSLASTGEPALTASPPETMQAPALSAGANLLPATPATGPILAKSSPVRNLGPYSIPVGSVLLYENFANYKEGAATNWGQNCSLKLGLDQRKWLVSYVDGAHPVGQKLRLPNEFYCECRYSVNMPAATRGPWGWWREPVASKLAFLDDRGAKYAIEWVIGCGNDALRLDLLGLPPANKYYHTIKLPGAAGNEVTVLQPTGTLRINWDNGAISVFVNRHLVATGTVRQVGQLAGFEVNVVKAKNGTLSFTDFKIAR